MAQTIAAAKKLGKRSDGVLAALAESVAPYWELAAPVVAEIQDPGQKRRGQAFFLIGQLGTDPDGATARFRELFPDDRPIDDRPEQIAAKRLAWAMAESDIEAALALAGRLTNSGQRTQALIAIASRQQSTAAAVPILERAANAARLVGSETAAYLARVARAALAFEETFADRLFEEAFHLLQAGEEDQRGRGASEVAFHTALRDPSRARLLIERELCRARDAAPLEARAYQIAAMAMCPVDRVRAVELARMPKDLEGDNRSRRYCEGLRKLAQWLLATGPVRETLAFDRWCASDAWTPGEETHW